MKEETGRGGRSYLPLEQKKSHRNHIIPYDIVYSHDTTQAGTVAEQKDKLQQPPSPHVRWTGGVTLVSSRHTAPAQQWLHKSLQLECPSSLQNARLRALPLVARFSLVEHPLPLQDGGPDRIVRHFVLLYRLLLSILGVISV